ncbi:MAG TPA: EAL domain-containing protein [Ilumatobacteraceae bacterium]|nr:EAL domain-containing protein [Ilumatobacteraceae bacterium]
MRKGNRGGSWSYAARMMAPVFVMLVPLTVLGFDKLSTVRERADSAHELAVFSDLEQSRGALIMPAASERIVLTGLAVIDELGIPRDVVADVAGLDLEQRFAAASLALDAGLENLVTRHGATVLEEGDTLAERLAGVRGQLDDQRRFTAANRGLVPAVRLLFDSLDSTLASAFRTGEQRVDDGRTSGDAARTMAQLVTLNDVLVAASTQSGAAIDLAVEPTPEHLAELEVAELTLQYAHAAFLETLTDEQLLETVPPEPVRTMSAEMAALVATTGTADLTILTTSTPSVLAQVNYLDQLAMFTEGFHLRVRTDAMAESDSADLRAAIAVITLSVLGAALAIALALFVTRFLGPFLQLHRRAAVVAAGELPPVPQKVRGTRELKVVAKSFDAMSGSLALIERQTAALATGELDSEALRTSMPSEAGRSIEAAIVRLATVTGLLAASESRSSAILEHAAIGIWTIGIDGRIRSANAAAARLIGLDAKAQRGRLLTEFLPAFDGEQLIRPTKGPSIPVLTQAVTVPAEPEPLLTVFARDISERKQFEEQLAHQARHDALTGLPNRFAVLEHLENALKSDTDQCAVMFVDIDGFKSVNDSHGHATGDLVLREIADRIRGRVRPGDFVARLGGDEFLIVMRSFEDMTAVASFGYRLIREIEQPFRYGDHLFAVSASVGLTLPPPGSSAVIAVQQADAAVYLAKRRGRGRVQLYDHDLQVSIEARAELELALRQAIRNDELELHFQPVFDVKSGECWGAEALVRWTRPGIGPIPPSDFIPVAERSALIFDLERWVLNRACERVVSWRQTDPDCTLRLAVNISGRHLIDGGLLADLDAVLTVTGADPSMLELELTETQLVEDLDWASATLEEIRRRGVTIAIDDFGTGYSSMTYLRRLPVDTIKIDRSFIANATESGYDATIVDALLTIGKTLGVSVVAEGVETRAQFDYVRARGVDRVQGYLLARPMPIPDAEALMFSAQVPTPQRVL